MACFYWLKTNNIFGINESGKVELPDSTIEFLQRQREKEADEKTKLLSDHH